MRGERDKLLEYSSEEHPVALQLGGCEPDYLRAAAQYGAEWGYDEINLNVGCPSDRVQSGMFGAVLMKDPALVARCISAMQRAVDVEVTVKCRIGVDDQVVEDSLPAFLSMIERTGVTRVIIHARKAWLQGLSPKENRDIPPLDYDLVLRMKQMFPGLHLTLNGGVAHLPDACAHLEAGLDGVMIGRAAYHTPYEILSRADCDIFRSSKTPAPEAQRIAEQMIPYIEAHMQQGGRLHQITRHMFGLFSGQPGARHWRRRLSELGAQHNAQIADYRLLLEERAALSQRQEELDLN